MKQISDFCNITENVLGHRPHQHSIPRLMYKHNAFTKMFRVKMSLKQPQGKISPSYK